MTHAEATENYKVGPNEKLMFHTKRKAADGGPVYSVVSKRSEKLFKSQGWDFVPKAVPVPKDAQKPAPKKPATKKADPKKADSTDKTVKVEKEETASKAVKRGRPAKKTEDEKVSTDTKKQTGLEATTDDPEADGGAQGSPSVEK